MNIRVEKYTNIEDLHTANSFTTGKESKMSLARAYALGHSPIRTQRFYIYFEGIPLFVASQLVRSHVGVQWYQKSRRPDRGGEDFRETCKSLRASIGRVLEAIDNDMVSDLEIEILNLVSDRLKDLPECFDRYAPTDLMADLNAEALINLSHKRLCATASMETREIWQKVVEEVKKVDPDLYPHLVKPCVATGICREAKCCGFNQSDLFRKLRTEYKKLFIK